MVNVMKAFLEVDKTFIVHEIPMPILAIDDVLISVKACGVCGSDWNRVISGNYKEDIIWGHEITGVVVAIGKYVANLCIGDRVVINPLQHCGNCIFCKEGLYNHCNVINRIGSQTNGGFAEYLKVNRENVLKLPANVDFKVGALTDCAAVAIHAVNVVEPENFKNKRISIIGSGVIAIFLAIVLRARGATDICLICRRNNSQKANAIRDHLGIKVISATEIDFNKNEQYDIVFEAVGGRQSQTLSLAVDIIRPKGKIAVLGVFDENYSYSGNIRTLFYKEAHLIGCNSFSKYSGEDEFKQALILIETHSEDLQWLITKEISLQELPQYFLQHKRDSEIKTIVTY